MPDHLIIISKKEEALNEIRVVSVPSLCNPLFDQRDFKTQREETKQKALFRIRFLKGTRRRAVFRSSIYHVNPVC